jgi:hypothetical protein
VATVVRVGPGTPFPHLRYVGAATAPAEQQDQPAFLAALDRVGAALGRVIDIFSGSGGPDVRGAVGSPATRTIGGLLPTPRLAGSPSATIRAPSPPSMRRGYARALPTSSTTASRTPPTWTL